MKKELLPYITTFIILIAIYMIVITLGWYKPFMTHYFSAGSLGAGIAIYWIIAFFNIRKNNQNK